MPQCPTCGSDVSEQATFCPDCGTDLKPAAATPPAQPAAPESPAPAAAPAVDAAPAAIADPVVEAPSEPATAAGAAAGTSPAETAAPPSGTPTATPAPTSSDGSGGARLTLKRGGALTNEVFTLGGRVVVGRFDPETGPVDVDLGSLPEATYVSRQHAELWPDEGGQWRVKDLGSRNGVFVRRQGGGQFLRVTGDEQLASGDEIALGNARFEFRTG